MSKDAFRPLYPKVPPGCTLHRCGLCEGMGFNFQLVRQPYGAEEIDRRQCSHCCGMGVVACPPGQACPERPIE